MIPTVYCLWGDHVDLHGSTANRMLRSLCRGEACIAVTLLDGLVLARSAFHTSVNYRSVVLFGRGEAVTHAEGKREVLRRLIEQLVPGRWGDVRAPSREELARTLVVRVPIDEASAKLRAGGPAEDEGDYALGCWAGEIPLRTRAQPPVDDARLAPGVAAPDYARTWSPADERSRSQSR